MKLSEESCWCKMRKGLSSRLNDKSKLSIVNDKEYKEMLLDPESLAPSDENFYSLENIEELADNMRLVGHLDPIIVGKVEGKFKIISGHRRTKAACFNKQNGYSEFNQVKCMVKEMSNTMFMLTLLSANAFNRKLTDWELVEQARLLKEYLEKAKDEGLVIEGKMRDYMADILGISKTKMNQINKINNNMCEDGKRALKNGDINFSKAHEVAGLPESVQKEVITNRKLTSKQVKEVVHSYKEKDIESGNSVSESDTKDECKERFEVKEVVCDYGIFEDGKLLTICNSHRNAELIREILKLDSMCNQGRYTFEEDDFMEFMKKWRMRT